MDESKEILNRTEANESDSVSYDTLIPDGYISKDEIYDEKRYDAFEIIESSKTKGDIFISPDIYSI